MTLKAPTFCSFELLAKFWTTSVHINRNIQLIKVDDSTEFLFDKQAF